MNTMSEQKLKCCSYMPLWLLGTESHVLVNACHAPSASSAALPPP